MENPTIPQAVLDASGAVTEQNTAREAAFAAGFAPDYTDVKGTRFYRVKVAHNWALTQLGTMNLNNAEITVATAFMLMHDADALRNEFIPLIFNGKTELMIAAYQAMMQTQTTIPDLEPVLEQYARDMEALTPSKKQQPKQDPTRSGGRGSSSSSAKSSDGVNPKS